MLIILIIPAGPLEVWVEAEPPLIASTLPILESIRKKLSALPKEVSPNNMIGRPSSCNCKYLDPPEETGTPRTLKFALPSPPEDSARIPGMFLNSSPEDLGEDCSICLIPTEETEILDSILDFGFTTPVTIISSKDCAFSLIVISRVMFDELIVISFLKLSKPI